jgi:hypothetical protein
MHPHEKPHPVQIEIYRRMTPQQRVKAGLCAVLPGLEFKEKLACASAS